MYYTSYDFKPDTQKKLKHVKLKQKSNYWLKTTNRAHCFKCEIRKYTILIVVYKTRKGTLLCTFIRSHEDLIWDYKHFFLSSRAKQSTFMCFSIRFVFFMYCCFVNKTEIFINNYIVKLKTLYHNNTRTKQL